MGGLVGVFKGLWSLLAGLKITGVEFCRPWLTVHYPRQEVDNLTSYRGHIELVATDGDPARPRCVVCWRCVEACPSGCISLKFHAAGQEAVRGAAGTGLFLAPHIESPGSARLAPPPEKIERVLDDYRLNYTLCSLCGLCVQSCPTGAIRFSQNVYLVGRTREELELDLMARLKAQATAAGAA